jgi:hypothetical protein
LKEIADVKLRSHCDVLLSFSYLTRPKNCFTKSRGLYYRKYYPFPTDHGILRANTTGKRKKVKNAKEKARGKKKANGSLQGKIMQKNWGGGAKRLHGE